MSEMMTMDRINRWKCVFCGSNLKRKLDATTGSGKVIGYSLMCCNCGHVDNFALSTAAIPMYTCGEKGEVETINIKCPLSEKEVEFCMHKNCAYRPHPDKEKDKPRRPEDKVKVMRIYQ